MAGAARDRGAGEDAFLRGGALKADRVPGIMSRCRLHDSDTLTLRLHLFEDPILDHYVHNHKTPFASVCLHGGYANLEYEVRDAGDARHHYRYRWLGSGAMSRPEKLPGDLVVARRSALAHYFSAPDFSRGNLALCLAKNGRKRLKFKTAENDPKTLENVRNVKNLAKILRA